MCHQHLKSSAKRNKCNKFRVALKRQDQKKNTLEVGKINHVDGFGGDKLSQALSRLVLGEPSQGNLGKWVVAVWKNGSHRKGFTTSLEKKNRIVGFCREHVIMFMTFLGG